MMGLLDDLFARPNQGGILNGAYPSPLMEPKKQYATNDFDSEFLPQQPNPFGPLPVPPPPLPISPFNGNAGVGPVSVATGRTPSALNQTAPFSFGGPQQPIQPQPPQGAQPQQPALSQPADPRTPKPFATPRSGNPPDYGQSRNVAVGHYQMPMFGEPAAPSGDASAPGQQPQSSSPNASPGFGDRAMAGLSGLVTNAHTGPVGALLGGLGGLVTGQRSDPAYQQQRKDNLTEQALLAKGVAPQDVQAALVQPKLLEALINQHFAKQPSSAIAPRWDGRGRILR
jgi:hypothetical protein